MTSVMMNWNAGLRPSADIMAAINGDKESRAQRKSALPKDGAIAVIPVFGIIAPRGNMIDDVSGPGSCSLQEFVSALRKAEADDSIGQIVLLFDTPGGSVYGVEEAANEIARVASKKKCVGLSEHLCASAGYWLASQCSEFYCSPSGEVGSIGVYTAHCDMSKALEEEGVHYELISAGEFKTEGNPYQPLTEEARAAIQTSVDNYYAMFTKAVARGRKCAVSDVRDGMGKGRCLSASEALAGNMIDGIKTFDEVISGMRKAVKQTNKPNAARMSGMALQLMK